MTIGVFLLMLFGAIEASLYAFERSTAVTAVAAGARVAAGGGAGQGGVNTPDLADAIATVVRVVSRGVPGTAIDAMPVNRPCESLDGIQRQHVEVCAVRSGDAVTVTFRGWPRTLVPDVLGLGWSMDVGAEVHELTFAR